MTIAPNLAARSVSAAGGDRFVFDAFLLEVDRRALSRDGREIRLRPKSFDVLCYLLQRPGTVVSKDEFLRNLWPGLVVTEDSLTQCIIDIRRALGDDDKEIVRTVRGCGYRLDPPVEHYRAGETMPLRALLWRQHSRSLLAGLAGLLLLAAANYWWQGVTEPAANRVVTPAYTIAVLPFVDLSSGGGQEHLADGIPEQLIQLLARSDRLHVISRSSSFTFRSPHSGPSVIGSALGVTHLLEGSVKREGEQLQVIVRLVNTIDGSEQWSQRYDVPAEEILELQSRISRAVAGELDATLERQQHAPSAAAYEQYMLARHFYNHRNEGDVDRAEAYYRKALALDPAYADAWEGLASVLNLQRRSNRNDWEKLTEEMTSARNIALRLDPEHPEALSRHALEHGLRGNWEALEHTLARALQLGHNNARVHAIVAGWRRQCGDHLAATNLLQRAIRLDPLSHLMRNNLAYTLYESGRLEEALYNYELLGAIGASGIPQRARNQAWILLQLDRAEAALQILLDTSPGPYRDEGLALVYHALGRTAESNAALARLPEPVSDEELVDRAKVHAYRGEHDLAFRLLERLTERQRLLPAGHPYGDFFWAAPLALYSPLLRDLHKDPRWERWRTEALQYLPPQTGTGLSIWNKSSQAGA